MSTSLWVAHALPSLLSHIWYILAIIVSPKSQRIAVFIADESDRQTDGMYDNADSILASYDHRAHTIYGLD